MSVCRKVMLPLCVYGVMAAPNYAAESGQRVCLNKAEQSAAVAAHKVVPLAEAIKALREHGHRAEVVRARLCRRNGGLDYVLTVLTRSGKVISADLDAANGELINGR